jgi:hypothetical protein
VFREHVYTYTSIGTHLWVRALSRARALSLARERERTREKEHARERRRERESARERERACARKRARERESTRERESARERDSARERERNCCGKNLPTPLGHKFNRKTSQTFHRKKILFAGGGSGRKPTCDARALVT